MATYYMNGEQYPYPAGASNGGSGEGYSYGYYPESDYYPAVKTERPKSPVPVLPHTVNCNGYTIQATPGQRKYGGPPPDWTDPFPGEECEVYCGRLPRTMLEDELLPLFEKYGRIWEMRLMMNDFSQKNRGFAFVRYTSEESALAAISHLNDKPIDRRPHHRFRVEACAKKVRLYIANIPKAKSKEELHEEFAKRTKGLKEVIIYAPADDRDQVKKNRGFCFLDYDSHSNAFAAKKHLSKNVRKLWGCELVVDWADPIKEPEEEIMAKVKVLYVRNLTSRVTEERLQALFSTYGVIERVKRLKDFAFVHFANRADAEKASKEQQGEEFCGTRLQIEWGKPPEDKRQLEEMLRARERRMAEGFYFPPSAHGPYYPSPRVYAEASEPSYYDYDPSLYYSYYQDYEYFSGGAPYYPYPSSLDSSFIRSASPISPMYYSDSSPPSSPEVYRCGPRAEPYSSAVPELRTPPPRRQSSDRIRRYVRHSDRSDRDRRPLKSAKRPSDSEDNWRRHTSSSRRESRDYSHGEPHSPPLTPPYSASSPNSPIHWRRR